LPEVVVSSVVPAPADRVWASIRRFDAVADWLPFVASSPIEDGGDPTRVGCVRVVTQADGLVFREVLVALSDADRSYSYTFVGAPIPVRDHRTTIRLLPITDGERTYAEWSSRFEIDPSREEELAGLMRANFLAGLRALAASFA
jgi:Polyketide cyclase / dehydrase and lipid transport